jgi:hypothetical protein
MKRSILAMAILFFMAGSASAMAEDQSAPDKTAETGVPDIEASTTVDSGTPQLRPGRGMMHGGGQHGKGQGGMMHGGGQHRQGQGGMMHGASRDKNGQHQEHDQVVHRLDMIEARMAKIEAMLEILMRR